MVNQPVSACLFDLDGLLVDSAAAHLAAYELALQEHGLALREDARALIRSGAARSVVLDVVLGAGHPAWQVVHDRKGQLYASRLTEACPLMPGAQECLQLSKHHGCAVAVVSNSRSTSQVLRASGLACWVDVIVDGTRTAPKPSPEGYHTALSELGVAAERGLAFEDAPEGAQAAIAAGLRTVVVGANAVRGAWRHWPQLAPDKLAACLG